MSLLVSFPDSWILWHFYQGLLSVVNALKLWIEDSLQWWRHQWPNSWRQRTPSLNLSLEHRSGVRECIPLELSPPPCLTVDRLILLKTQYRHLQLIYLSCDLLKSWHLSILGPLQSFYPFFCNVPWPLERIMRLSSLGPSNHLFLVLSNICSHELLPLPMFTRNRGISLFKAESLSVDRKVHI